MTRSERGAAPPAPQICTNPCVPPHSTNGHEPQPWPLRIEPGDTLVIYTDGLVEARRGKEEYGVKRLRETVAELGARPAGEIAAGIVESVNGFTGGGVRRDDVTVVVVKRTGDRR